MTRTTADGDSDAPDEPRSDHPSPATPTDVDADVSRSGFLHGGALALGAGALGAALATGVSAQAAPAGGKGRPGRGVGRGVDPNPDYHRPEITRLATVTGPGITTRFRMDATDLGAPAVTPDGRILVIFGDTFEEPAVGDSWWRSPSASTPIRSASSNTAWSGSALWAARPPRSWSSTRTTAIRSPPSCPVT
ncbi:DUF4185 domain-containing protein [Brachybacterium sp. Z12]|uniref:DUF4185 domain-containing protein n=1 Tax=Brachybacterium sp. Z12 TaxID=2759167 RepID=UPI00223C1E78|nr:DUF4185 domain-containing protein [Brachybacterium sp. Z12]